MTPLTAPATTRGQQILTFVAVIALAANLRTAAASLGIVLTSVQDDFSMGGTAAGVLVSLPLLCFAVFGSSTTGLARALGIHRTMLLALTLVAAGSIVRALTESASLFFAATTVALVGTAIGNVFLPPLVKIHFPHRIAQVSSLFVAATIAGSALASVLTVPLADLLGDWRDSLLLWGVLAAVAAVPWLFLLRSDSHHDFASHGHVAFGRIARSRVAWAMAIFFSLQSMQGFVCLGWLAPILVDAGNSDAMAGLAVGFVAVVGIPVSLLLPRIMGFFGTSALVPLAFAAFTGGCWVGIYLAPTTVPWLWGLLLGFGSIAFPWTISLIPLRSDTVAGTAALSGFVQTIGYLVAGIAPFGVGLMHDLFDTWTPSIVFMAAISIPFGLIGVYLVRAPQLEATLPPPRREADR